MVKTEFMSVMEDLDNITDERSDKITLTDEQKAAELVVDCDDVDEDLQDTKFYAHCSIYNKNSDSDITVWVDTIVDYEESDIEVEYEPDGCSTYVPYGEGSVLYDDGTGDLKSVNASRAVSCFGDHKFILITGDQSHQVEQEISEAEAINLLKCTKAELDDALNKLDVLAEQTVAKYLESVYMDGDRDADDLPNGRNHHDDFWDKWDD